MVRENEIADPALTVARELSLDLQRRYGLKLAPIVLAAVDDDLGNLNVVDPAADLVLDVWTDNWSIVPADDDIPPGYKVNYRVNLRLIDAKVGHAIDGKSGAVIAEGTCTSYDEISTGPTYDELVADRARRLKVELNAAAEFCVELFRSKILSTTPEP